MTISPATLLLTPADSARAIASVYTVSLLATLPLGAAAVSAVVLRRASAEVRALVWRSAVVTLLVMFIGRQLPLHWMAWVVPSLLAAPLVVLGRMQVTAHSDTASLATYAPVAVSALCLVYIGGVIAVIAPTVIASIRARRSLARARPAVGEEWSSILSDVCAQLGIRRGVRVFLASHVSVPMTWGAWDPVVALPAAAERWDDGRRRMVLMHELAHVRAADWLSNLAARIVCALFWFHPGVWLLARALRQDCELACDDRVIASGIRRSDYAELLVHAADLVSRDEPRGAAALALSRRGGLRARLAAVLDVRHDVRPLARGWATGVAVFTLGAALPMSVVQLGPTRGVLTTLMLDAQWESRAYAVLGLAQRADSVAVARNAAEADPNPSVRAWARYALGDRDNPGELRALLRAR